MPKGIGGGRLASCVHFVDAVTRMQLTAKGQVADCVPFKYRGKQKMSLYKGEGALAERRAIAAKLNAPLIRALRKPRHVAARRRARGRCKHRRL